MHFYIDELGNYTPVEKPLKEFGFDNVAAGILHEEVSFWNENYTDLGKSKDLNEERTEEIQHNLSKSGVKAFILGTNCESFSKNVFHRRATKRNPERVKCFK